MRRHRPWLALAAGLFACGGCQTEVYNPWSFAEPPARATDDDYARPKEAGRPVVAVAEFGNPAAPQVAWPDVGAGMSEALRRAMRNDGKFDVRAAGHIDQLVDDPNARTSVGRFGGELANIDFIVTGQVTDFHHTAGLPRDISRWGILRRRSEAVVAIEWRVIDVRSRRVIATDHTYGTCDASRDKSIEELYAGLDFSAYLFWNSPLGKAGHLAVDKMVKRVRELLPSHIGDPSITKRTSDREVELIGGWTWGLAEGQEYYVAIPDESSIVPVPVYDADTDRPLMVRIGRVKKKTSEAWLMGKPPEGVELKGAILSREPPPPIAVAGRKALGDVGGGS